MRSGRRRVLAWRAGRKGGGARRRAAARAHRVDGGERVVEEEQLWPAVEGARERDALLLPPAQGDAALAHLRTASSAG